MTNLCGIDRLIQFKSAMGTVNLRQQCGRIYGDGHLHDEDGNIVRESPFTPIVDEGV